MNKLISNRYYITTIIAIFLSLSLGILIGGTLGQQWINEKQQNLISFYEAKSEKLQKTNSELEKSQEELRIFYHQLKDEYKMLFTKSISQAIDGKKFLWINSTDQKFKSLQDTIELAGGVIYEIDQGISAFQTDAYFTEMDSNQYDIILIFPKGKEEFSEYKWLHKHDIPVIYLTDQVQGSEKINIKIDIYEHQVNMESLNEHYQFIAFIKNLLLEKTK